MKKLSVLLVLLTIVTIVSSCGASSDQTNTEATPVSGNQITINAKNFSFDATEYRVKAGEPVTITLKNTQGIHGIAINDLDVKLDSQTKSTTITPDKPGEYEIVCSIMCGSGHSEMKSKLIVE